MAQAFMFSAFTPAWLGGFGRRFALEHLHKGILGYEETMRDMWRYGKQSRTRIEVLGCFVPVTTANHLISTMIQERRSAKNATINGLNHSAGSLRARRFRSCCPQQCQHTNTSGEIYSWIALF
jgi:hypothetical protein